MLLSKLLSTRSRGVHARLLAHCKWFDATLCMLPRRFNLLFYFLLGVSSMNCPQWLWIYSCLSQYLWMCSCECNMSKRILQQSAVCRQY